MPVERPGAFFYLSKKREEDVVMDRKTLEEYLKIYPEIDEEIQRTENEIERLKTVIQDYQAIDLNKFPEVDHVITGVINAANSALRYHTERLRMLHETKAKMEKAFTKLSFEQRKIIELRHWNGQYRPTKWKEVAKRLNYHEKSVERLYRGIIDLIIAS